MSVPPDSSHGTHRLSVVVPVYRGAQSLPPLLAELEPYTSPFKTTDGHVAVIAEVLLVFDHGPDTSARTIRELARRYDVVRPVWLSRNFGQHAATLAGMASSGGDWIVTMDEDGQHDPRFVADLLDTALRDGAGLVYAQATNPPPHGLLRNAASRGAKRVTDMLTGNRRASSFASYRLVVGELGRSVAAYAGSGVYLDVALGWVCADVSTCPVTLRNEGRPSGYRFRTLLSHFWRMVLTSGTRGLRIVAALGVVSGALGIALAVVIGVLAVTGGRTPAGWASTVVALLVTSGAIMVALGVVAEYVGVAVDMAMGRPAYLIVADPEQGPLGWGRRAAS